MELPLDVGDDAEVLFHACTELTAVSTQLRGTQKCLSCLRQRTLPPEHDAQRVEGFCCEQAVVDLTRDFITPAAKRARQFALITLVPNDPKAPKRFGQHRVLPVSFRRADRPLVLLDRFQDAPCAFPLAGA